MMPLAERQPSAGMLRAPIPDSARHRGVEASFCPSEPARPLMPEQADGRAQMPVVRSVAAGLQAEGLIEVTQPRRVVAADGARGPIRLRLAVRARPDRGKTP